MELNRYITRLSHIAFNFPFNRVRQNNTRTILSLFFSCLTLRYKVIFRECFITRGLIKNSHIPYFTLILKRIFPYLSYRIVLIKPFRIESSANHC